MEKNKILMIFAAIGLYGVGKFSLKFLSSFVQYFVLPRRDLKSLYGDGWAVITGASDGLGKQYAIELAKSGFKIILIARNPAKLDEVA
jgi:17beta-estradiol 17-dehydrogenase / very-long-chain 3-oxoacyl-CoA reductase